MSGTTPTPLDVARRLRKRTDLTRTSTVQTTPEGTFHGNAEDGIRADLRWVLYQIGIDSIDDRPALAQAHQIDAVQALFNSDTHVGNIAQFWSQHLDSRQGLDPVLQLAFEYWFSRRAAQLATALRYGYRFERSLQVCRQRVGLSLYDYAREVNWRRPFVYTRTLSLARLYLRAVLAARHLMNEETLHQFLGKVGVATVHASRFETVSAEDLDEAIESLLESTRVGNPAEEAMPYVLEALTRRYDLSGEIPILVRGVRLSRDQDSAHHRATWYLSLAELWLRLAERATTVRGRSEFVAKAGDNVNAAVDRGLPDSVDYVRSIVLSAVVDRILEAPNDEQLVEVAIRGMNTPFGLADHVPKLCTIDGSPGPILERLLKRLRDSVRRNQGGPLMRRVFADTLSAIAATDAVDRQRRVDLLREAISTRKGSSGTPLTDEMSLLRHACDLLRLGELTNNSAWRVEGIDSLLSQAEESSTSCVPLALLGREVERTGALSPQDRAKIDLRARESADGDRWKQAIREGDPSPLYRAAAARAFLSPDVRRRHLGGRSNVLTTEDYLGASSEVFVFKRTPTLLHQRELSRASRIADYLTGRGLQARFGLTDHLAELEEGVGGSLPQSPETTLTVRRFAPGGVLATSGQGHPIDRGHAAEDAAEFLGHIHACEREASGDPVGYRRELWKKEVGWWLRTALGREKATAIFDLWWKGMDRLPILPRRDAHPYNWIVGTDGRVLAIDLDATGWRPIGYELAQLTDDVPLFEVSEAGLAARTSVVERYHEALQEGGFEVAYEELHRGYVASLLGRATRALTVPGGESRIRDHGERVVRLLEEFAPDKRLRDWAARLLREWALRRGVPRGFVPPQVGDARRRHISRALSYHLRHDSEAIDDEGWASIDDAVEWLRSDGLGVSSEEVLAVASSIDETRFEVESQAIRARYGHTVVVNISYERAEDFPDLYHSTTSSSLNRIFQQAEGLVRMKRQWVHLSSDWLAALRAGLRKPSPVLLRTTFASSSFYHAGGTTWLAPEVPTEGLEVVPLYEVFRWVQLAPSLPIGRG